MNPFPVGSNLMESEPTDRGVVGICPLKWSRDKVDAEVDNGGELRSLNLGKR